MMNILFIATLILLIPSADASQVIGVFTENSKLQINIKDDPTSTGPYEASDLFAFLNVPVTQRPYRSPFKVVSTKIFTLTCVVPLVTEPTRLQFSDCDIELLSGDSSIISDRNKSASFHQYDSDALKIFNQFSTTDYKKFTWESVDKQIYIESTPQQFIFNYRGI
jgi:hypothetical protein